MSERVYLGLVEDLSGLLEEARRSSARAVNSVMTATYWAIGRRFYRAFPGSGNSETVSRKSHGVAPSFPLPWSHYVKLLARSRSPEALAFYHAEAVRGGWSVRQLDRQLATKFYERTALSKNKAAMLAHGAEPRVDDVVSVDEQVKDPMVLEFLGLKDEYSESDLEEALVRHLEAFLLELGGDLTFVGRQRRLRITDAFAALSSSISRLGSSRQPMSGR